MISSTSSIIDPRIHRALQRHAEERVVVAVLHASTFLGILAIIASAFVGAKQDTRSRFLAIQCKQALWFQIITTIGQFLAIGLFMTGFQFAFFAGLIARTGAREPELTSALTVAAIAGAGTIIFFLVLLPLLGVWAAVRVLRGHNFRYPILGRMIARSYQQQHDVIESVPTPQHVASNSDGNITVAGLAHLSILVGFGPVVAVLLWGATPNQPIKLTFSVMQAALFQLCLMGIYAIGACAGPYSCLPILAAALLPVVAALRAFRGKEVRYPILGNWLARYLGMQ